jgi:hypothetical protein
LWNAVYTNAEKARALAFAIRPAGAFLPRAALVHAQLGAEVRLDLHAMM